MGAGANFLLPISKNVAFVNKVTYIGFNNSMKARPTNLASASISEFYIQEDIRLHILLATIFDFYIQAGVNYCALFENASDGKLNANLVYGSWGFDSAGGLKIVFTEGFGIFAECGYTWNGIGQNSSSDISGIHLNTGVFLGFLGSYNRED